MKKWFVVIGVLCAIGLIAAVALIFLAPRNKSLQMPPCPSSPPAGTRCSIGGIEFVAIPDGTFAMGDSSDHAAPNEQPVHEVTLDAFWMATTELTFKQWNAFIVAAGYPRGRSQAASQDHPVVSITWEDAKAYSDWFSKTNGVLVRLPTEAEWEYAARGGLRGNQYPNGNSMSPREANYASDGAVEVARYPPNGYGLYDLAGNVFEWVGDWYDRDYYRTSARTNPPGPATEDNALQRRADRGGGWCMNIENVRVSARHAGPGVWDVGGTADCLGVRLVMELSSAK